MSNKDDSDKSSKRGFATMDKDKQKEVAAKGGKTSHQGGTGSDSGSSSRGAGKSSGARGGSSEQHAKAGSQSHKKS